MNGPIGPSKHKAAPASPASPVPSAKVVASMRSVRTPRQSAIGGSRSEHPPSQSTTHVADVAADHDELAVSHVDDVHEPERDRQADRNQQEDGGNAQAVEDTEQDQARHAPLYPAATVAPQLYVFRYGSGLSGSAPLS